MWMLVISFVVVLFSYIYYSMTKKYGMFEAHGIFEPPKTFPLGTHNNWKVMTGKVPFIKALDGLYAEYGQTHPYLGTFANADPVLVVNDLDMAKNVMIKDFDHFTDRRRFLSDVTTEGNKFASNMLVTISGEKWKKVRSLVSPAFTSGKLKAMVPFIQRVNYDLLQHLDIYAESKEELSLRETLVSYTLDCIATCGFGIEANSFKDPDGEFRKMVLKATGGDKGNKKGMFRALLVIFAPRLANLLKITFFDEEFLLFFANIIKSAVAHRRKEKIKRGDLIDLVLEALEASEHEEKEVEDHQFEKDATVTAAQGYHIPRDEIETLLIGNTLNLFFAGFDTTSTATSVTMGFLAKYPEIQERLFQEINDAIEEKGSKDLDYDTVHSLPYLDKVFKETLRFYFTGTIERVCTKDYSLPGSSFVVPRGMLVQIPSSAMHKDRKFYPDPDNFNPDENWSDEAKAARSPYAFMSFGQGPRNCIGMRFAFLMAKTCLVKVLATYKLTVGPSMPDKFEISAKSLTGMPVGGIWCKFEKRS